MIDWKSFSFKVISHISVIVFFSLLYMRSQVLHYLMHCLAATLIFINCSLLVCTFGSVIEIKHLLQTKVPALRTLSVTGRLTGPATVVNTWDAVNDAIDGYCGVILLQFHLLISCQVLPPVALYGAPYRLNWVEWIAVGRELRVAQCLRLQSKHLFQGCGETWYCPSPG